MMENPSVLFSLRDSNCDLCTPMGLFNQVFYHSVIRGVTGYLKFGGQVVMRCVTSTAAATATPFLFCPKLGGQLITLPTRQLHPWFYLLSHFNMSILYNNFL